MRRIVLLPVNIPVLMLTIICFLSPQPSWSEERESGAVTGNIVSIDCQGIPINNVLNDISRQSGLEINYDQKLENDSLMPFIPFSDEITAIDAVVRLLRGKNTIIEFNDDQKNIDIRLFEIIN